MLILLILSKILRNFVPVREMYSVKSDQEDRFFPEVVELPLEDVLDLHSFPPKEIKTLVENYLQDAYEAGFPHVRIIHGKGIGVQREIVRLVASRNPHVESVDQASEGAGSWGATIVRFRRATGIGNKQE